MPFGGEVGVVGFVDIAVGKAHVEIVEEGLHLFRGFQQALNARLGALLNAFHFGQVPFRVAGFQTFDGSEVAQFPRLNGIDLFLLLLLPFL